MVPVEDIGVVTADAFWPLRASAIAAHDSLALFPSDYGSTQPVQQSIYGQVDWSVGWLKPALFYIQNPYILVTTNNASSVTAAESATNPTLRYCDDCTIVMRYEGIEASHWFSFLYDSGVPTPGVPQLTLVNARDAGFRYASVPIDSLHNVDPTWTATDQNAILGKVHTVTGYFYHRGQYGVNNLSPDSPATRLALVQRDVPTRLQVDLWRAKPSSAFNRADVSVVIEIEP
jgi:hypothetical protein